MRCNVLQSLRCKTCARWLRCTATCALQSAWCRICGSTYVMQPLRCDLCGALDFNKRSDTSRALANIPPAYP
eukprot:7038362-Pyramimonas_sp.AAC.1